MLTCFDSCFVLQTALVTFIFFVSQQFQGYRHDWWCSTHYQFCIAVDIINHSMFFVSSVPDLLKFSWQRPKQALLPSPSPMCIFPKLQSVILPFTYVCFWKCTSIKAFCSSCSQDFTIPNYVPYHWYGT